MPKGYNISGAVTICHSLILIQCDSKILFLLSWYSACWCHVVSPFHLSFPADPWAVQVQSTACIQPCSWRRYRSLLLLSVTEGRGNEFWRPWDLFSYFLMLSFFDFLFRIFFFQIICWQNLLGILTACLISLVGAKFVLVSDCRAHYQTFDRKSVFQQGLHYKICCQKIPSYWFFSGIKTRSA